MRKSLCFFFAAILCFLSSSGTVAAAAQSSDKWSSAMISDSTLYVAAAFGEDTLRLLARTFEERTGCHVVYTTLSPLQALEYLAEPNARVDVFLGGTSDLHETLKMEDLLLYRKDAGTSGAYSWRYNDHDCFWEPVCLEMLSIGVNLPLFQETFPGETPPATLEELADPRYKNKLIMTDSDSTDTGLTLALSVLRSHGRNEGSKLLRAIGENVGEYAVSDFASAQKAALGFYPLTLGAFSSQNRAKAMGLPLEPTVYPQAGWSIIPVSMMKGVKNLAAAESFLDFVLSKDGGELICSMSYALPARDDVAAPLDTSHKLREYPVSNTFWSYRETTQREYALTLTKEIKKDYLQRHSLTE